MKSNLIFTTMTAVALAASCGGSDETAAGAGGSGTGGASSSSSVTVGPSSSSSSGVTSGTGGAMGDGNDTFDTAEEIMSGMVSETLSPTGDVDYFYFQGTKGQLLWAYITDAQSANNAAFDPKWVDTVITLYDETHKQIAENNEPRPHRSNDAELFTILPADGKYYIRVEECHTWAQDPTKQCQAPADKDNASYTLVLAEPDPSTPGWVADTEMGDDATSAEPIDYAPNSSGGYYLTGVWGTFRDGSDIDVYSFSLPPDTPFMNRSTGTFYLLASGTSGNGSTTPPGNVWIADAATPASTYALVDGTQMYQLWPPLQVDHPYLLFVQHPSTAAGTNDFYFALHSVGGSNPVEKSDPGGNDTPATAEALTEVDGKNGVKSFFFDGDIAPAGTDVDHFVADVPAGLVAQTTLSLACGAQRHGSGLRGFKGLLLLPDGTAVTGGSLTETPSKDFQMSGVAIPAGATQIVVRIEAASQDPNVTSTFYHCGFHFVPPAP